ncbi:MAG: hypothetical protein NTZ12_08335 [Candidatus Aminicenantes bacterium]|nr:hypothetical protein [Candidatus Aminicenantes bacterium]
MDVFKLMELMRHSNIETTRRFYVGRDAQNTAAGLWAARDRATGGEQTAERNKNDNTRPAEQIEAVQETTQPHAIQGVVKYTPQDSNL